MISLLQALRKPLLMIVIALLSALGGVASTTQTDIGQTVSIAIDEEAAINAAAKIIRTTPTDEIVEALKKESDPVTLKPEPVPLSETPQELLTIPE